MKNKRVTMFTVYFHVVKLKSRQVSVVKILQQFYLCHQILGKSAVCVLIIPMMTSTILIEIIFRDYLEITIPTYHPPSNTECSGCVTTKQIAEI